MFEHCTTKTWTTTSHSHDNNSLFLPQLSHSFKGVLMECFSRMKLVFKQNYHYRKNSLVRHEPAAFCKIQFSSSIFENTILHAGTTFIFTSILKVCENRVQESVWT